MKFPSVYLLPPNYLPANGVCRLLRNRRSNLDQIPINGIPFANYETAARTVRERLGLDRLSKELAADVRAAVARHAERQARIPAPTPVSASIRFAAILAERKRQREGQIGGAVMQVSEPRIPCYKLVMRMEAGGDFAARFLAAKRTGFYCRVLQEGPVARSDAITLLSRDLSSPTVTEDERVTAVATARTDHPMDGAARLCLAATSSAHKFSSPPGCDRG